MRPRFAAALLAGLFAATPAAFADCSGEVSLALQKQGEQKSWRKVTNLIGDQGPMTMTVEYVMPDRMRQQVKFTIDPNPFESILVGDKAWTNSGEGWVPASAEETSQLLEYFRQSSGKISQEVGEFECLGAETVEGQKVRAYKGLPPKQEVPDGMDGKKSTPPPQNEAVRIVYLDLESGLPARTIMAVSGKLDKPVFREIYTYPADLKIEAPAELKK